MCWIKAGETGEHRVCTRVCRTLRAVTLDQYWLNCLIKTVHFITFCKHHTSILCIMYLVNKSSLKKNKLVFPTLIQFQFWTEFIPYFLFLSMFVFFAGREGEVLIVECSDAISENKDRWLLSERWPTITRSEMVHPLLLESDLWDSI